MELTIFTHGQGSGLIMDESDIETNHLSNESIELHGLLLNHNEYTTLDGLFTEPLRFAGIYDKNVLCFFLGEEIDIFEKKKYYNCFYYINQNRIAKKYSHNTCRDFNWINGKWK
jgi:hypothetical protein